MGLFSIVARLTGNTSDFDRKMKKSMSGTEKAVGAAAGRIKGYLAGAFGVGAIIALEKRTIEFGAKIADTAKRFSVSTKEVQELSFAADQSGASLENLIVGLARISKIRGDILAGKTAEGAGGLLEKMGFGKDELKAKNAVQLMKEIGTVLASDPNNNDRTFFAQLLFGETGGQLLPVFDAGLETMAKHLRDIGGLVSDDNIANLKAAADALTDIKMQMLGIASEGAPALVDGLGLAVRTINLIRNTVTDTAAAVLMTAENGKSPIENMRSIGQANAEAKAQEIARNIAADAESGAVLSDIAMPSAAAAGLAQRSAGRNTRLNAGSLAAIGGFVGNGGGRNAVLDVQKQQLEELKEANRSLDTLEKKGSIEL